MSDLFDDTQLQSEVPQDLVISDEGPFVIVPVSLISELGKDLGACGVAVYVALKTHANRQQGMTTFILAETLANELDMGESTVRRELTKLSTMGLITKTRRFGRSSVYRVISSFRYNVADVPLLDSGCSAIRERYNHKNLTKRTEPFFLASPENKEPTLHEQVKQYIHKTSQKYCNSPATWDGSEAKILKSTIAANPTWELTTFERLIDNRYASDGSNGQRPRTWLGDLGKYMSGPLDKYGNPKQQSSPVVQREVTISERMRALAAGSGR